MYCCRAAAHPAYGKAAERDLGGRLRSAIYLPLRLSAQRFVIISEIRLRASADILRRRLTTGSPVPPAASAPVDPAPREALTPARARSFAACAVSDASRSFVWLISRSSPPIAQPSNSADFSKASF